MTRLLDGPAAWYAMRVLTSLVCASLATLGVAGLWCAGISIPLFMVAGELMVEGGIMDRLVDFANSVVGRVQAILSMALLLRLLPLP